MTQLTRQRREQQLKDIAERIAAALLDRALNPQLWAEEIPAVWNHSDLESGDHARDKGTNR